MYVSHSHLKILLWTMTWHVSMRQNDMHAHFDAKTETDRHFLYVSKHYMTNSILLAQTIHVEKSKTMLVTIVELQHPNQQLNKTASSPTFSGDSCAYIIAAFYSSLRGRTFPPALSLTHARATYRRPHEGTRSCVSGRHALSRDGGKRRTLWALWFCCLHIFAGRRPSGNAAFLAKQYVSFARGGLGNFLQLLVI